MTSLPGGSFSTTIDSDQPSTSYLPTSITATATSVFNNLKNPFDSLNNASSSEYSNPVEESSLNKKQSLLNKRGGSLRQRKKQSLFSRFEYSSFSFPTPFNTNSDEPEQLEEIVETLESNEAKYNQEEMIQSNNTRTSSQSGLTSKGSSKLLIFIRNFISF